MILARACSGVALRLLGGFERADAVAQLVDVAKQRGALVPVGVIDRREGARVDAGLGQRLRDARLRRDDHVVAQRDVPRDADRAADHAVLADARAAGDTRAARDHGVSADAAVVADLHKVVDLHALFDDRVGHGPTVDRRVRADFDVRSDRDAANLRNLDPATRARLALAREIGREAEAVRADHGARMHDRARAELAAVIDRNARIEVRALAHLRAAADEHIRVQAHVLADHGARFHRDVRPDHRTCGNLRRRVDVRARVHARLRFRRSEVDERLRDTREISIRIGCDDEVAALARSELFQIARADQDRAGAGGIHLRQILRIGKERQLLRTGLVERRERADALRRIPDHFAAEPPGDFLKRKCHTRAAPALVAVAAGAVGCERLQHLVGDVDARTDVHRFLHDQVVMLLFGDLLDDLVRAVEHRGEFFVATLIQVFAELALLALEVAVELRQIALLLRAVGRGHRRTVLVDRVRHGLQTLRHVLQVLVALRELSFELGLRGLRGGGFAQDAVGVDRRDLRFLRMGRARAESEHRQRQRHGPDRPSGKQSR
ncbi:hypothetical protein PT2222_50344 [Paraburkholderia tropica]